MVVVVVNQVLDGDLVEIRIPLGSHSLCLEVVFCGRQAFLWPTNIPHTNSCRVASTTVFAP